MHFFFSKLFNTVNDKQTADTLYMSTFSSGKCFVSILILKLISQYTKFCILAFKYLEELF